MLAVQDLSVSYGKHPALQEVNLRISAGEVLAVIGPNGAGKSTLIRAISGVLPTRHGRILINSRPVRELNATQRARFLAVVPQARSLPAAFSVYETVLIGRTPYLGWMGQCGPADHKRAQWALARTGADSLADRPVGKLSGGEQQRVLLARALVQDAPVLLLDEPTTYLDLQHQSTLLNLVRELAAEKELAVLMVLHDLNLAGLYADRIALLVNGRIQACGVPEEVLTGAHLSAAYQVPVQVMAHPAYGTPLILPDGVMTGHRKPLSPQNGAAAFNQMSSMSANLLSKQ